MISDKITANRKTTFSGLTNFVIVIKLDRSQRPSRALHGMALISPLLVEKGKSTSMLLTVHLQVAPGLYGKK
jgi:hypothetical protein